MAGSSPEELQRRIAAEFEREGWEYDLDSGADVVAALERDPNTPPAELAGRVTSDFLTRNNTNRQAVAAALARAVGRRSVARAEPASLVINDHRYSINLGHGAAISNSQVNVGGTQINVSLTAKKEEVLGAAEALIRAGLTGAWNAPAARDLAAVIDERGDVSVEDIRALTTAIAKAEQTDAHRVRDFLAEVAANAVGGALGVGISAGLGFLL